MKLVELDPQFFRYETRVEEYDVVDGIWDQEKQDYFMSNGRWWKDRNESEIEFGVGIKKVTGPREYLINVPTVGEAQGIMFLCPKCFKENNGPVGTHSIHMTFSGRGVDPEKHKHQWNVTGSSYSDLNSTPSYRIVGGCEWHGYITNGEVTVLAN